MKEIKSIEYKSSAKIIVLFAVVITLLNIIFAIAFPTSVGVATNDILVAGVISLITTFIGGLLIVVVYNLLAKWVGGIKLEI